MIRELRQTRKISLAAFARRIGWNKGRQSRYESDETGLTMAALARISGILNVPSVALLARCLKEACPELADADDEIVKFLDGAAMRAML